MAADQNPDVTLITDPTDNKAEGEGEGGEQAKPKGKKKKRKGKKKRKPKSAPAPDTGDTAAPPGSNGAGVVDSEVEGNTTTTEPTEDDESSDEEPDFSGGVLIGRDGKLVEYVREL